eukprot:6322588-Pyramimonas_sp.AAC.3
MEQGRMMAMMHGELPIYVKDEFTTFLTELGVKNRKPRRQEHLADLPFRPGLSPSVLSEAEHSECASRVTVVGFGFALQSALNNCSRLKCMLLRRVSNSLLGDSYNVLITGHKAQ